MEQEPYNTREQYSRDTRARALAYVFERYRQKKQGGPTTSRPDDAKESRNDRAKPEYTG